MLRADKRDPTLAYRSEIKISEHKSQVKILRTGEKLPTVKNEVV